MTSRFPLSLFCRLLSCRKRTTVPRIRGSAESPSARRRVPDPARGPAGHQVLLQPRPERAGHRPSGRPHLPATRQEVVAAGLTPAELTDHLTKAYSSAQLKDPEVTVIVRSFSSQRVYVDGEVGKPGMIPLAGPTTVRQAISQAGGFLYTGNATDVMLIRRGPENQTLAMMVNMQKVLDGTDLSQDIYLKPFDIVYVPKTAITNANLWIEQYLTRMVPRIGFTAAFPVGNGIIGVDTSSTIITPAK